MTAVMALPTGRGVVVGWDSRVTAGSQHYTRQKETEIGDVKVWITGYTAAVAWLKHAAPGRGSDEPMEAWLHRTGSALGQHLHAHQLDTGVTGLAVWHEQAWMWDACGLAEEIPIGTARAIGEPLAMEAAWHALEGLEPDPVLRMERCLQATGAVVSTVGPPYYVEMY
jgi:hypothetical protein